MRAEIERDGKNGQFDVGDRCQQDCLSGEENKGQQRRRAWLFGELCLFPSASHACGEIVIARQENRTLVNQPDKSPGGNT